MLCPRNSLVILSSMAFEAIARYYAVFDYLMSEYSRSNSSAYLLLLFVFVLIKHRNHQFREKLKIRWTLLILKLRSMWGKTYVRPWKPTCANFDEKNIDFTIRLTRPFSIVFTASKHLMLSCLPWWVHLQYLEYWIITLQQTLFTT